MIEYYNIFKILCLLHLIVSTSLGFDYSDYSNNNYWSDNFDENKNCVREKEMEQMRKEDPNRCYTVSQGASVLDSLVKPSLIAG